MIALNQLRHERLMELRVSGLCCGVYAKFMRPGSHFCPNSKSGSSISSSSVEVKPKIPLYLRPPSFSASLSELKKWHRWAKNLASSVGSSFVRLDNGPDSTLLRRELNWLLQDLLELQHHPVILSLLESDSNENVDTSVALKAPLEELYCAWRQRIEERRPFQYVVGCQHWRDLVLSVQEGVLIPRPETEMIIDIVERVALKTTPKLVHGLWADLGTGSGAIAIATARALATHAHAHAHAHGRVIATDLSPVAVAVAAFNVQRYGLQDMVEVRKGSWFEPLKDIQGKLAGVVSNPPYIASGDIPGLQAEVGQHEPKLALDGGITGTNDLLHLIDGAASMLKPGGFFAFETNGDKQCEFLLNYIENDKSGSFCNVHPVSDFDGIQRFVLGFRQRMV
ncbi:Heat stress transcription factor A-1, putative isoform 1 [Theobroma cacao]|uniref:Heat stress transcription factor A-1, putative isoform 1 n=1 Tax=Theobroma cacao TaxID=3641 RepID=A0A061G8D5_THECC|nr:Heat stress transcription factor A-1, putative isoform 1 [Theobroma cacao]EOY25428.1 Heat stress transcription factor A-1, putative isoform 1 [Theobroma cacao]